MSVNCYTIRQIEREEREEIRKTRRKLGGRLHVKTWKKQHLVGLGTGVNSI